LIVELGFVFHDDDHGAARDRLALFTASSLRGS
jgi:hypothetical protein